MTALNYTIKYHRQKGGYIALISVLIIGAVGTAVIISLLLLGIGNSRTSFAIEQSSQAKASANACAEEALEQIRNSTPFTGTGNLRWEKECVRILLLAKGGRVE